MGQVQGMDVLQGNKGQARVGKGQACVGGRGGARHMSQEGAP